MKYEMFLDGGAHRGSTAVTGVRIALSTTSTLADSAAEDQVLFAGHPFRRNHANHFL